MDETTSAKFDEPDVTKFRVYLTEGGDERRAKFYVAKLEAETTVQELRHALAMHMS
jgi:hypothetical protein